MVEGTRTHREISDKWNEMTLALVERRLRKFLKTSRRVEALVCVLLPKNDLLTEVRDCLRGARNSVGRPPRYWGLAEELIFEAKGYLKVAGYALPEG
ncbi:hypothetical protein AKJ57_03695 [candidate division MSBL1 archaeon SCGC-AAA259A05]|uniref:Uncharacterized protein n=1 Tax=candidate division MSBL1 archaeon SCGC-AAA259A05 TaxID=1698259 RepID=A0A133U9G2_9EURY|nr:hypothetical protein AKJ57_03695 [candidate division MSBL1 archaeon SCGC-AAA259A05]